MNERDTIGPEASLCFRSMDNTFVDVTRDAVICSRCYNRIYPNAEEGTADIRVGFCSESVVVWSAIEVKYAGRSSYPFSKLQTEQKEWLEEHTGSGRDGDGYVPFIWIGIGERINGADYARKTWLIPFDHYLEIEEYFKGKRKSIPYDYERMEQYELEWRGGGLWNIPGNHLFWEYLFSGGQF